MTPKEICYCTGGIVKCLVQRWNEDGTYFRVTVMTVLYVDRSSIRCVLIQDHSLCNMLFYSMINFQFSGSIYL